jgi:hypothetical protein
MSKNISIVWDFDGTLTPNDSTSKTVEILKGAGSDKVFWDTIKQLRGDNKKPVWEHVFHQMSLDRRVDFITPADFNSSGELSKYIKARCSYILKQYQATNINMVVL